MSNKFSSRNTALACRVPATACALFLIGAVLHGQSNMPSTVRFNLKRQLTVFDGVQMDIVQLISPDLTLTTDTLGAWTPLEHPLAMSGISFKHRTRREPLLSISLLGQEWASESDAVWEQYQATIKQQMGGEITISDVADSVDGPPAIRVFGYRTREAMFTPANTDLNSTIAEHHVFATNGKHAVALVLRSRAADIDQIDGDFRFFMSRLSTENQEEK